MENGEMCPKCGTKMAPNREALRIRGTYVGHFAAMTCPICRYHYFMEDEYNLALSQAEALGLVGPTMPYTISLQETDFGFLKVLSSSWTAKITKEDMVDNFAEKPNPIVVNPVPVPIELKV
jgi:hypothetical protein